MMDVPKLLLNPVRMRIMQYIALHDRVTTAEIVEALGDVPRATVYQHVKLLEENGLIQVAEENRIRGTVEKVYTQMGVLSLESDDPLTASNSFFLGLMQDMQRYLASGDVDCQRDLIFFTTAVLMVKDGEYEEFLKELTDLVERYTKLPPAPGRRLRRISMVSTLPENS